MAGQVARRPPTDPRTAVLRQQFAPGADDAELAYFGKVADHLAVDPWAGHICLVPYWTKDGRVYRPQLTVAGRRFIAQRTGHLRGIIGPQWSGPRRYDDAGAPVPLEWLDLWDHDDAPYAARVLVHRDDWDHPANGTVKWSEFAQYDDKERTKLGRSWATMPSHMLGKVAESLALRRAFSEVEAAVAYIGDDDDAALVREVNAETGEITNTTATERAPAPARRRARADDVPDWVRDQDPENQR